MIEESPIKDYDVEQSPVKLSECEFYFLTSF